MRRSANAKFPTKYDVAVFSLIEKIAYIITVTFPKIPIIIAMNLNTTEHRRTLFGIAWKVVLLAMDVF